MAKFWDFLTEKEDKNEERLKLDNNNYRPVNVGMWGFVSGIGGDRYTAEEVLSIPVAKICTDLVCNSIKTLPVELYRRIDENTVERIIDDYRLLLLNDAPNCISTGTDFKAKLIQDLLLHGNAYIQIVRNGNTVESLWNIDASNIGIKKLVDENMPYIVKDIKIQIDGYKTLLNAEDIMILTISSNDGGLTGEGVISRGTRTIELALNEIELSKNLMNNGSSPMSIVKLDKSLSPEAQQRLRDSWERMYKGSNNAGKLIVLEQGMEYEKLSYSPQELGLTASRTVTQKDMCNLFGVPESMVDSTANTYGNIESSSIRFLQYSIMPYVSVLEDSLNRSLLLEKEKGELFFKVNTDDVLKTTQAERYEALNVGISSGILSLNEARIKENLKPIPDNFHRLSLGAVMYDPVDRSYFIPNMSTVIDAENKQVISSPDMAKEGIQNNQEQQINGQENDNKQQNNNEQQLNNKEENDNNEKE